MNLQKNNHKLMSCNLNHRSMKDQRLQVSLLKKKRHLLKITVRKMKIFHNSGIMTRVNLIKLPLNKFSAPNSPLEQMMNSKMTQKHQLKSRRPLEQQLASALEPIHSIQQTILFYKRSINLNEQFKRIA